MPRGNGTKFHYLDHDSDVVDEEPPVQDIWYEVFHAYDVRVIQCALIQDNDELAVKDIEVRWTIDGNVYLGTLACDDLTVYYARRHYSASLGGTSGLEILLTALNAASYTDKRGQDFKVEIRITSVLGTNQRLRCWCVRETLELT